MLDRILPVLGPRRTIRFAGQRYHFHTWDEDRTLAQLIPVPGRNRVSVDGVTHCLRVLHDMGYEGILTGALGPVEDVSFRAAGFEWVEDLIVLRSPLPSTGLVDRSPQDDQGVIRIRPLIRTDLEEVWDLDRRCFPFRFRSGPEGIGEAARATRRSRSMVATDLDGTVVGYAVSGCSGREGFLQRLAVDPPHQRRGVARRLVDDARRWLTGLGSQRVYVNTQPSNDAAIALYRSLGFDTTAGRLAVLEWRR